MKGTKLTWQVKVTEITEEGTKYVEVALVIKYVLESSLIIS